MPVRSGRTRALSVARVLVWAFVVAADRGGLMDWAVIVGEAVRAVIFMGVGAAVYRWGRRAGKREGRGP